MSKKGNPIALLPIGVFLVIYLGLGLLFEYGMKIPMGFYNIPIVTEKSTGQHWTMESVEQLLTPKRIQKEIIPVDKNKCARPHSFPARTS